MDGVVIVEELTGALHFTRSFSKRFDELHLKSDRMNLGALLFALENFAADSVLIDDSAGGEAHGDLPAITFLQTEREAVALARSSRRRLIIGLFTHPSVSSTISKPLARRIAFHYDRHDGLETRLGAALNQSSRLFREACARAIDDEVNRHVDAFEARMRATLALSLGFLLLYYSPSLGRHANDKNEQDDADEEEVSATSNQKEGSVSAPTATTSSAPQSPPRLQTLMAFTRSLLPLPSNHRHSKVKKNAVVSYAGPRAYHRYRVVTVNTGGEQPTTPLSDLYRHSLFPEVLVDALGPILRAITTTDDQTNSLTDLQQRRIPHELRWRRFPLPRIGSTEANGPKLQSDLHVWKRRGLVLTYTDHFGHHRDLLGEKHDVVRLLDTVEPLVRCALKVAT